MGIFATCAAFFALMNGFACTDDVTTISRSHVVELATGAGFAAEDMETLLCVIDAESSFRPGVVSWTGSSYGLAQVHYGWWEGFADFEIARPDWSPQTMMDAGNALHAMKYIYDRSGWEAWDGYGVKCNDN